MTQLSNTFEGGSDGVALTQGSGGNTGGSSGDWFDEVRSTSGIVQFENTPALVGSKSCPFGTRSANAADIAWSSARRGLVADDHSRTYFQLDALPPSNFNTIGYYSDATSTLAAAIQLITTGKLRLIDSAGGAALAEFTTVLALSTKYRLELRYFPNSGSGGSFEGRLYAGDSSALETKSLVPGATAPATSGRFRFGILTTVTNLPSASGFIHYDQVTTGASDWLGPITQPLTLTADVTIPANWGDEGDDLNLFQSVDEATPSTSDYIESPVATTTATEYKGRLQPRGGGTANKPAAGSTLTVRVRAHKDIAGGDTVKLDAKLYQSNGATQIGTTKPLTVAMADGDTEYSAIWTAAEIDPVASSEFTNGLVLGLVVAKV